MARIMRHPRRVAVLGVLSVLAAALVIMFAAASAEGDPQTPMDAVHDPLGQGCTAGSTTDSERTSSESFEPIAPPIVTDNSVTLSGIGSHNNDRVFFFWRKQGEPNPNYDLVEGKAECTISGLEPSTTYVVSVIRVQASGTTVTTNEEQITVTTLSETPPTPVVSISGWGPALEGISTNFTLTATPAPTSDLSVQVTISANGDFGVTTGVRTVTIPTSGHIIFPVATSHDLVDEPNGSVTATLADGTDYDLGASTTATVVVLDDDDGLMPPATGVDRCSSETRQEGAIKVASVGAETWCPVATPHTTIASWDHAMGVGESLTYNVSVPAGSCPATVQVRARWWWRMGELNRNKTLLMNIVRGSDAPEDRVAAANPTVDLHFSADDCAKTQSVTVFGVPAADRKARWTGAAEISHTLTRRNGNTVAEAGPVLHFRFFTEFSISVRMGVPSYPDGERTISRHTYHDIHGTRPEKEYVNNVGPVTSEGDRTDSFPHWKGSPIFYARAPIASAQDDRWTELCVYVHPREIPDVNGNGDMWLPQFELYRSPYRQLTLIPFAYPGHYWQQLSLLRNSLDPDFTMPLEIERYTSVVNRGNVCRPVAAGDNGTWEKVYSGGPKTNTAEALMDWQTNVQPDVVPLTIQHQDYGEYINLRIRGVYGIGTRADNRGQFTAPSQSLAINLRFTFAEAPSGFSPLPLILAFFP